MGFAVELLGQRGGALVGAIADVNLAGAVRQQVARSQFAHLARADQVDALAFEVAEDLLGQIDRDRSDGNRRRGNGGLGAHSLGNRKGAREQRIELRVHRADGARGGVGFLHLAENLRLANHHRVQTGGNAKHVTHGVALAIFVEILAIGLSIEAV